MDDQDAAAGSGNLRERGIEVVRPRQSRLGSVAKLTLREALLLLLIVPVVIGWVVDRTGKQELIDRYRWQARALEDAIRTMTDARALTVTDDLIDIEIPGGRGKRYPYGTPRTP